MSVHVWHSVPRARLAAATLHTPECALPPWVALASGLGSGTGPSFGDVKEWREQGVKVHQGGTILGQASRILGLSTECACNEHPLTNAVRSLHPCSTCAAFQAPSHNTQQHDRAKIFRVFSCIAHRKLGRSHGELCEAPRAFRELHREGGQAPPMVAQGST